MRLGQKQGKQHIKLGKLLPKPLQPQTHRAIKKFKKFGVHSTFHSKINVLLSFKS
jgi:hypothetical protein